ncbi:MULTISPECIES: TonB-dependent receptor [unclassified Leeuwenhoekiella]|uniref:TonB-dependent receptor n=1 Tax=unclassified Leeuwenhoekiella TaxID=2615029 RepID=UPI000C38EC21|nr:MULTISPECIES: TonB-dependent receptor [unclassified Leeuwenhoekiella]MAW94137.1 TonB-dependent receptor [Leeuwenhoekiella sp.]MBA82434.1 TonB-dependent receptor [Leeuwenhoekiella sp.]|tara:strand:+ start:40652 stop:42442 length:1791 start_codon:yes stop_codon:yes gene_type:complete
MINTKYTFFYFSLFILGLQVAKGQDKDNLGTEVVNVVKPYTPEIGDAFKVKATPMLNDSVNTAKKKVTYGIFSVPVASTFTPAKGQAAQIEKSKRIKLYDNYVRLGFGTYTTALAEFYSNWEINRDSNFGVYLNHNSSQGDIDGVVLDDFFYDTDLNLNYTSNTRDYTLNTDLDLGHKSYNWYGVADDVKAMPTMLDLINPTHNYFQAGLSGTIEFNDGFFEKAYARAGYFGDNYQSSEIRAIVAPEFMLPIADHKLSLDLKLDYVNGSFERNYQNSAGIEYSHLIVSANPSVQVLRDDLTLDLGITAAAHFNPNATETNLNIYPSVCASYRVVDEYFIAYGGLEGGLMQNSYQQLATENPFVSPTLETYDTTNDPNFEPRTIVPTDQKYDLYAGIKGKLSSAMSYNLRASYLSQNDRLLYKNNPRFDDNNGNLGRDNYQFGNSFGIVIDDLRTLSLFGELNFDVNSNLKMRVNGEVFTYETETEAEAWNLPDFKASFFADYQIDENWFAGLTLFYVGERKDEVNVTGPFNKVGNPQLVTLDSFFDANAHAGYRLNDQLSFFVRVNNALGNNYQRWVNYPVQGIQGMAGATYRFDW